MIDPVQVKSMLVDSHNSDEYRLGSLAFTPDVIYDIGANVGGVSLLAAELFPEARIVAVEPEEENYQKLVEHTAELPNVHCMKAALAADKQVFRSQKSPGIGNWIFCSASSATHNSKRMVPVDVPAVTLDELYATYGGERYVLKMDCESGEMMLLTHEPSRKMALGAPYLAGEFHLWGRTHEMLQSLVKKFMWWVYEVSTTHNVDAVFHGGSAHIWATKRG